MEASQAALPVSGVKQVLADYVTLTKPKVQLLLLLTTITTMYVAGDPSPGLVAITVVGGFLSAGGAVIDPSTATPGSASMVQIENNIRRSFHAFEDDDERGEDHHEGHHGNDDGEHD